MGNHFYGSYHWELCPVDDRLLLLDALGEFCDEDVNLFVEVISPSFFQKVRFWRMRAGYQTHLDVDAIVPRPTIFHITLSEANLQVLKQMVRRDGLSERSITHLKGYRGNRGLFWFHGFCDEGDQTVCCSRHVSEATIGKLESRLGIKAEKKFGELKSDRERKEEFARIAEAIRRTYG